MQWVALWLLRAAIFDSVLGSASGAVFDVWEAERLGAYTHWLAEHWVDRLQQLGPVLEAHAQSAESARQLAPEVVAALKHHGACNLFLPRSLGGEEVDPVSCALITEELARSDSAAAWFLMVANSPRLMAASWPEDLVELLWLNDPHTLVAASGHSVLQAQASGENLMVSGRVGFSSGCHFADYIAAPALIEDPQEQSRVMVIVPASDCVIEDDWDVMGMRGTGSNSVVLDNVCVARTNAAPIAAQLNIANRYYDSTLYRCPGRVMFATYVPISLAIAGQALDILNALARTKTPAATSDLLRERQVAQLKFGKALANFRAARGYFLDSLREAWERADSGEQTTDAQRADLYLAGTHGVQASAETVRLVADAAGTSAIYEQGKLARLVRDMEVLRHHGFASENRYASVAQQMWGSKLDYPLLLR